MKSGNKTKVITTSPTFNLTVLIFDGLLATSYLLMREMLVAAEQFNRSQQPNAVIPRLNTWLVSPDGNSISTSCGEIISPNNCYQDIASTDMLVIPSRWRHPHQLVKATRHLKHWLQGLQQQGSVLCGVSTGSYVLAESCLLNNHPGTTHWYWLDDFASRYPLVDLRRQHLITRAGNIYCAGSVNSVADLTTHLIEAIHGLSVARATANQFSPEIRQPFEGMAFTEGGSAVFHGDEIIAEAQAWLQKHLSETICLAQVAEEVGLTVRSFNRRFVKATGMTPGEYLCQVRLQRGALLLRSSNLSVGEIANRVGYLDHSYFSRVFRHMYMLSPSKWRASVKGKLFAPDI